jgi:hypothetical protein
MVKFFALQLSNWYGIAHLRKYLTLFKDFIQNTVPYSRIK